ncbi:MAG TPA: DUF2695 domain-containing protein [Terracidiphilus sp.]|nr:DUF2695 domain-containing protein [Terracidiphilus sp.]
MEEDNLEDEELIRGIAPYVLGVLKGSKFFGRLDDLFCPADPAQIAARCDHSFGHSTEILRQLGFDPADIAEIVGVLRANGACCDCDVLSNVAEESRLKAKYWKSKAAELLAHENRDLEPSAGV